MHIAAAFFHFELDALTFRIRCHIVSKYKRISLLPWFYTYFYTTHSIEYIISVIISFITLVTFVIYRYHGKFFYSYVSYSCIELD